MSGTKPELLNLERIILRNADLYLYPEYVTQKNRFSGPEQNRVLIGTSRGNKVMTPANGGEPFVVKMERSKDDALRKVYEGKAWMPIEKEVAVARALSELANTEFADMRIIFEEPYGLMIADEGKSGLFRLYPSHQDELGIEQFDKIRSRIKTERLVQFNGKQTLIEDILEFQGERVATETIVNYIKRLYYPDNMGMIVMETNGITHPDYKEHNYQENGKSTALINDFEMGYFLGPSELARHVAHTWKYFTETVGNDNFTFDQLLRSSDTIEGMVHQMDSDQSGLRNSEKELHGLQNRRREIHERIVHHTGMQTLDDPNIRPGPAFEVISYIKDAKPSDLL
ncbi:hypothetical protein JXA85_01090 [Candidatus Woesearchaeota archaeon]|nr:hypothetical protein [Candidatus Woesearchaeota archaeon]